MDVDEPGIARVWDVPTGHLICELRGSERLTEIAFSEDGRTLLIGAGIVMR